MHIGHRRELFELPDIGIVQVINAGRFAMDLHRYPPRVVNDITDEVYRSTEHGLGAHGAEWCVETAVAHHSHITYGSIRLETVIMNDRNVVVVDVYRHGQSLLRGIRIV